MTCPQNWPCLGQRPVSPASCDRAKGLKEQQWFFQEWYEKMGKDNVWKYRLNYVDICWLIWLSKLGDSCTDVTPQKWQCSRGFLGVHPEQPTSRHTTNSTIICPSFSQLYGNLSINLLIHPFIHPSIYCICLCIYIYIHKWMDGRTDKQTERQTR